MLGYVSSGSSPLKAMSQTHEAVLNISQRDGRKIATWNGDNPQGTKRWVTLNCSREKYHCSRTEGETLTLPTQTLVPHDASAF